MFFFFLLPVTVTHKDYCPDFGNLNVKYEAIAVSGSKEGPFPGGCFSKEIVPNGDNGGDHRLNIWLGVAPLYGNFCHEAVGMYNIILI